MCLVPSFAALVIIMNGGCHPLPPLSHPSGSSLTPPLAAVRPPASQGGSCAVRTLTCLLPRVAVLCKIKSERVHECRVIIRGRGSCESRTDGDFGSWAGEIGLVFGDTKTMLTRGSTGKKGEACQPLPCLPSLLSTWPSSWQATASRTCPHASGAQDPGVLFRVHLVRERHRCQCCWPRRCPGGSMGELTVCWTG